MNLILITQSNFLDASKTRVRLVGRRRDHALSVCRVAVGDTLRVGMINGNRGIGVVTRAEDDGLELSVTLNDPPPPPLPLTLILALPRPKALKRCIEAVTAMGVKNIFIIESWRVEKSYWSSPALADSVLYDHILLGLEQAGDTMLPRVEIRKRFKPFVEDEIPGLVRESLAIVGHPCAENPCPSGVAGAVTLAVGPEGGFIPFEIELLEKIGFIPVSLGRRVLRVEYALPAIIGRLF
jgi:16S rRNA (uracil1498-N3)-methyltransferase